MAARKAVTARSGAPRRTAPAKAAGRAGAPDLRAAQESVGYNIRRADVYMREQFRRMLGRWRIRPAEYSILRVIGANPAVTQAEIADVLYIKRQNLGGMIARLERLDWVRRAVDPTDRRRQTLVLSAPGRRRLDQLIESAVAMDAEITGCWTDAERATVVRLLQRLYGS